MTASKHRWAWLALAGLLSAALLWTHRYEYAACDTDGCVVINRWTGSITFRPTDLVGESTPEGTIVVRSRRVEGPIWPAMRSGDRSRERTAPR